MSKRRSTKGPEKTPHAAGGDEAAEAVGVSDSRDDAVEELDEALDALPDGGDAPGAEDESENPLARVDVSGETSFDSAEFEAEDEAGGEEAASDEAVGEVIQDGGEDDEEEDDEDADDSDEDGEEDDEEDGEAEAEVVIHDADAEDLAEAYERMRAGGGGTSSSAGASSADDDAPADDEVAPGGAPRE